MATVYTQYQVSGLLNKVVVEREREKKASGSSEMLLKKGTAVVDFFPFFCAEKCEKYKWQTNLSCFMVICLIRINQFCS